MYHAAGAIMGSTRIRNPISGARAVMQRGGAVALAGESADWFAATNGVTLADPLYFQTDERRQQLLEVRAKRANGSTVSQLDDRERFGTVGAVALDIRGNIAAGTSTGGLTNKQWGRIGDTPQIGSGTYASSTSCAVSATGAGGYFIRWTAARDVCALVEYKGVKITAAADDVIRRLKALGGDGGLIAMDPEGRAAFAMNGRGMYRGYATATGTEGVAIYREDPLR